MADQHPNEGSSTRNLSGEGSDATVELNVKTLDSQIYSFRVEKNMPVQAFKEKIASEIGVPVGQQRLIFRGKVLKDEHPLSEYQVDNGHTLHLVARQPTQQSAADSSSSGDTNANNANHGNDATSGIPHNRIGQISHSVVLGTFNVGDSGEAAVPDISRVIGAVLNSFGIGGQATINGMQSSAMPTMGGQSSQGSQTAGASQTDSNAQGQTGSQTQTGQRFPGQQIQSLPQFMQIPMTAVPIPDALTTLSEFMSRLDHSLSQNGSQPNASSDNPRDVPRVELPSNVRGLQALSIILRQAERLLGDRVVATLSHIAGRLEQDGASSDPSTRGQIQTESMRVGLAMQHLGALFLELSRTILTLQMGHPPAEAFVNPGPAVYISPSGPNPIMVQPFPLQTNSLFGGSGVQPNPVTVGAGNLPRNVNIHIHAGTALAPVLSGVGTRTSNGEGTHGEQGSGTGSAVPVPLRMLPLRNVIAVPTRPTGAVAQSGSQPGPGVPVGQPQSDPTLLSSVIAEVNSQLRGLVGTMQGNLPVSGAVSSGAGNNASSEERNVVAGNRAGESTSDGNEQKEQDELAQGNSSEVKESLSSAKDLPPCLAGSSSDETTMRSIGTSENAPSSSEKHDPQENSQNTPLGLGLGGLDRKRRPKQPKPSAAGTGTAPTSQNSNGSTSGQQLLQSLASHLSGSTGSGPCAAGAGQAPPSVSRNPESGLPGHRNPTSELDPAAMMAEVIQSPALNGLLASVSEQTGVGSPNVLRDMLQQLTQNPQVMNTVGQIAQQVESQGLGNMFSGLGQGGGAGGGLDLSRMMQQMMPMVTQVLGHGQSAQSCPPLESEPQLHHNDRTLDENVQIDLRDVAQRIGELEAPEDIFHAVAESAARMNSDEAGFDILNELSSNEDIINDYMEVLQQDIQRRLQGEHGQGK